MTTQLVSSLPSWPLHPRWWGDGLALLAWARWRMWRASARILFRDPIKPFVIVTLWGVLLTILYLLAWWGLRFIYKTAGFGPFLLDRLWYLFLFVVLIMLAVSHLASTYSTLIRSPETHWWMSLPLPARTLCRAKWVESSTYSAWAVMLLVLPLGLAYLAVLHKPLWLVGWLLVGLLIPLIGIITACSSLVFLVWLRWLGRIAVRREVMVFGFVIACIALFWVLGERHEERQEAVWFIALQELLPRMRIAMSPWLPSSWVAKAFQAGIAGRWVEGVLYAGLLWTTALMSWRLLDHAAHVLLFPVLWRQTQPVESRPARHGATQGLAVRWWMGRPAWACLAKDVLLVIRDPLQWSQAVVFFGLLGAYFANIHRIAEYGTEPSWRIGIASLNLACTLLVFGSLAVRFLFPQMSLEGRSLWLLRLAPHGTRQLVYAKLRLYSCLAVLIVEGLLWLSVTRLGVPLMISGWLGGVGIVASLTLVAMMVGLGAWWIDPEAQDPARIVSSSKGALALVAMLFYIGCVVCALVVAWTSWLGAHWLWFSVASVGLLIVSWFMSSIPLQRGLRTLERLESIS